jgi:arabinogalactan endo-1,4-beta-galactosidase
MFDALKKNNAEWDVIGMSIYPSVSSWKSYNDSLFTNIKDMISRYSCPVMICETGMDYSEASTAKSFLTDLITRAKAISN